MVSAGIRLAAALAFMPGTGSAAAAPACADLLPAAEQQAAPARAVTALDLARLRDIGHAFDRSQSGGPLALSPDGRFLAFQLRRADPAANRHCLAMVVLDLEREARSRLVDQGGELLLAEIDFLEFTAFPTGSVRTISPRWSPDGAAIAYLRRDPGGPVRLWRARRDGTGALPVSPTAADVRDFSWSGDGRLLFALRRASPAADPLDGAATGHVYDRRFFPIGSSLPLETGPLALDWFDISPEDAPPAPAAAPPQLAGAPNRPDPLAERSSPLVEAGSGRKAWVERSGPSAGLHAIVGGSERRCGPERCPGRIEAIWWTGGDVAVQARHGVNGHQARLYRWSPASGRVRELHRSEDLIASCLKRGGELICLHEGAARPRGIVAIQLASGRMRSLFDPNPEFARLRMGAVERRFWTTERGAQGYADLVLPPGAGPGRRHPLVIVQYRSRGFLRGGVGDEAPIHSLAARGYAVLSVDKPEVYRDGDWKPAPGGSPDAANDWPERTASLDFIETAIAELEREGIIDPTRIGMHGFSDGSEGVQFAAINSSRFSALSASSCCHDPYPILVLTGPAYRERDLGRLPPAGEHWRPLAIPLNPPDKIPPLLMQLSDWEFRAGLETHARQPDDSQHRAQHPNQPAKAKRHATCATSGCRSRSNRPRNMAMVASAIISPRAQSPTGPSLGWDSRSPTLPCSMASIAAARRCAR